MHFTDQLLSWYHKNHRDLPWRLTRDPYKIWLSEVILQQTRVEQGMPYYYQFLEAWPTLKKLAAASEDEVLRLWQGLGYYSRGRNLLTAARQMITLHKGFPSEYDKIRSLKGIGDYTAAAIASMAFDLPHAVVDGNVYRFLSRYFDIDAAIDSAAGKKIFRELAESLLDKKNPGLFNQAMMEMGALVCKPKPLCSECVFAQSCLALKNKTFMQLPVKAKKAAVRSRFFYYLVIQHQENVFIRQRKDKDIWQGLFEFPLIECSKTMTMKKLMQDDQWQAVFENDNHTVISSSTVIRHQLTHQLIHAVFIHVSVDKVKSSCLKKNCKKTTIDELKKFAMPQLIVRYLNEVANGFIEPENPPIKKSTVKIQEPYFINFALVQS